MKIQDIPFSTIDWSNVKHTVQPGKNGTVISRVFEMGNIRARMVEFTPGYLAGYFGEIGHLFGMKTAGCPVKSATPIL